jgi:starch synthase
MHIIHIASELAPLAKVGGLGDVILGLCRELSWKKHDVDIIIPKYDCMDNNMIRDLAIDMTGLKSYFAGEEFDNIVWVGWVENLKVYFIDPQHPRRFFNRSCIYGCDDDMDRFLYFSRAALELIKVKGMKPDAIHTHDWQTAAIAPLIKDIYKSQGLDTKVAFTIHNLEYQGFCLPVDIARIGLTDPSYNTPQKLKDPVKEGDLNLMKGAIIYSDYFTTVSPNYAKEIQTTEGGKNMQEVIKANKDKFSGILNGVDYSFWNPEIDHYLPTHFSPREMPMNKRDRNTLDNKAFVKKILRETLHLDEPHRPIVGVVTRLVPQKGLELLKHSLFRTLELGGQFVLLGSSPIPSINAEFHELKHRFIDHPHVSITLHHQETLAHLIYGGSDMFMVPSLFEPCGLTQLIALKYGSVPIVRRTGGLADTIFDVDHSGLPFDETNGYTFDYPDAAGVDSALDRAIKCWFENPDNWRKLVINGMKMDYSWNLPADEYIHIYRALTGK